MAWPPDYLEELNRRKFLCQKLNDNPELWETLKPFYAANPGQWINDFCVTYDPRNKKPKPKTLPFCMFPRQEYFIDCLQECVELGEGLLVEKSRDMGASWLCCAFSVHQLLFNPGASIGWGSRKQDLVDKIGDPDSIFEKMRIIIRNIPAFMRPKGYVENQHATFMKIVNPENGATVTGEAGDNIGRGGRKMMYFKDESAHYERADKIEASLGDNTDVQVDISSVNGTANVFYRRRMAGEVWEPGKRIGRNITRVFIMDWRDHPLKTIDWYNRRREKAQAEGLLVQFAQEVDRDYSSSVEGIIIKPEWVKAAIDAHIKLGIEDDGERRAALDVADEGTDKNALAARYGIILKHCDDWAQGDTGQTAQKAVDQCELLGVHHLEYDADGVGAGVKAETNRLGREDKLPKHLVISPWRGGFAVNDPDKNILPGDKKTPTNKDYFENLKAQSMWRLAQRFYKTYLAVTQGREYDHGELISIDSSIPKLHELVAELSQPTAGKSKKGKMLVNKKPDGTKSPNLCDSVSMCYNPVKTGIDYSRLVTM